MEAIYARLIRNGRKTLSDVPSKLREAVAALLENA